MQRILAGPCWWRCFKKIAKIGEDWWRLVKIGEHIAEVSWMFFSDSQDSKEAQETSNVFPNQSTVLWSIEVVTCAKDIQGLLVVFIRACWIASCWHMSLLYHSWCKEFSRCHKLRGCPIYWFATSKCPTSYVNGILSVIKHDKTITTFGFSATRFICFMVFPDPVRWPWSLQLLIGPVWLHLRIKPGGSETCYQASAYNTSIHSSLAPSIG